MNTSSKLSLTLTLSAATASLLLMGCGLAETTAVAATQAETAAALMPTMIPAASRLG